LRGLGWSEAEDAERSPGEGDGRWILAVEAGPSVYTPSGVVRRSRLDRVVGGARRLVGGEGRRWAFVPLLAVGAYASVLGIGFLSDDFAFLGDARANGLSAQSLLPVPYGFFYRPVGMVLTWDLGWWVWGFNPLPYHLEGLLAHAGAALCLGLWLAEATARRGLGWLAGSLFAVFPLHMEAVGWLAAQWDALAALFGIASLWLFTIWWHRMHKPGLYLLSLLAYGLGVFTKESLLSFLPLFAMSAWLCTPWLGRAEWRRLVLAMVPFGAVLCVNVGLRLATWGRLGGYPEVKSDYAGTFWDDFVAHGRVLLSPINSMVLGGATAQVVGALSAVGLLLGLVWYGHAQHRLLLVAGGWILLALLPVLNLTPKLDDLQQNRFLYLPAAGYCVGAGALLYEAIASAGRRRMLERILVGLLLVLSMAACWAQIAPWHVASAQVSEINEELLRLIPPQARPTRMVWYVENMPDNYRGAYVQRLGLGVLRAFTVRDASAGGDVAAVKNTLRATEVNLAGEARDAFALRFRYDENSAHSNVEYAAGMTGAGPPPAGSQAGSGPVTWDFRNCAPAALQSWQVQNARASCGPGKGLGLSEPGEDAFIVGPDVAVDQAAAGARFVRLRVSVSYPKSAQAEGLINQWYWRGPANDWSEERSRSMPVKADGVAHVYWTFLPTTGVSERISRLRFDPANGKLAANVQWVALDLIR
jgi:hypothetical protein